MSERQKKPGVIFWATVAVALMLLYPISFGPACWVYSRATQSEGIWSLMNFIYAPILRAWFDTENEMLSDAITWYADLGARDNVSVEEFEGRVRIFTYRVLSR